MEDRFAFPDPSPTFLQRFAAEMQRLAADLEDYQSHAGVDVSAPGSEERVLRAQALDELVQRCREMANVAGRMTTGSIADRSALQRVLAEVRLAALADRLAGGEGRTDRMGGELDLF